MVYTSGTTGRPKGELLPVASLVLQHSSYRMQTHNRIKHHCYGFADCPAGALHTYAGLTAHINALVTSWEWQSSDRILHCLPLHHVHGIINALHCAHAVGATVEFLPKFSPTAVWDVLMVRIAPSC